MTLERFACRISGPIDAAINLAINITIPWLLLPWNGHIAWFGWPSAFSFIGTMTFCVALFATFFGVRNGVAQRAAGLPPGPVSPNVRWHSFAWRMGLLHGLTGYLLVGALFLAVNAWQPDLQVPNSWVIVGDGLLAAVLAYGFQVRGVLLARRL